MSLEQWFNNGWLKRHQSSSQEIANLFNIVVELDGRKVTPPVSCGLLAGTFRNSLLEEGDVSERVIMLDDLKRADAIWLINSVRKWSRATASDRFSLVPPA